MEEELSDSVTKITASEDDFAEKFKAFATINYVEECPTCYKNFATKASLRVHINDVHSDTINKTCKCCSVVFSSVTSLKTHMKRKHKNVICMISEDCIKPGLSKFQ